MVAAVSSNDSPFFVELVDTEKVIVSADNRRAAVSSGGGGGY